MASVSRISEGYCSLGSLMSDFFDLVGSSMYLTFASIWEIIKNNLFLRYLNRTYQSRIFLLFNIVSIQVF